MIVSPFKLLLSALDLPRASKARGRNNALPTLEQGLSIWSFWGIAFQHIHADSVNINRMVGGNKKPLCALIHFELVFEKKELIPDLQRLLVVYSST